MKLILSARTSRYSLHPSLAAPWEPPLVISVPGRACVRGGGFGKWRERSVVCWLMILLAIASNRMLSHGLDVVLLHGSTVESSAWHIDGRKSVVRKHVRPS